MTDDEFAYMLQLALARRPTASDVLYEIGRHVIGWRDEWNASVFLQWEFVVDDGGLSKLRLWMYDVIRSRHADKPFDAHGNVTLVIDEAHADDYDLDEIIFAMIPLAEIASRRKARIEFTVRGLK